MKVIGSNGNEITEWKTWERPQDEAKQWVEGRSAMEIAKAFFRSSQPALPPPLLALLATHPAFSGFVASEVRPELETNLPPTSRGPRHHDVWIRGAVAGRRVVLGIEAKVDEPFDAPLASKHRDALERSPNSDFPERLRVLGELLFGGSFDVNDAVYAGLGYQLLSGIAGTLIQAAHDDAPVAAFVIYELVTSKSDPKKRANNAHALESFVRLLPGNYTSVVAGHFLGPIAYTPALPLPRTVELYVAKVVDVVS